MVRPNLHDPGAVLGTAKARAPTGGPGGPALTAPARDASCALQAGTKERPLAQTKELTL
jgi:hypothetical protein